MDDALRAPPDGAPAHATLFIGGPPMRLQLTLGLIRPGELRVVRRGLLFVLVAWLPLCLLAALEGTLLPRGDGIALLVDAGLFARIWLAGPLLLWADAIAGRGLSRIASRFAAMFDYSPRERARFEHVLASTRRLRDAPLAEVLTVAIAYALSAAVVGSVPLATLPLWHHSEAAPQDLSRAGWWYALVTLPMLLALLTGWLWRLALWTRFLALTARLRLPLVPVHPDRAAGVGFVSYSLRDFGCVGAALGAIVAGSVANQVVHHGSALSEWRYLIFGTAAVSVVLFTLPLLAFSRRLLKTWRRGMRSYGQLATSFGMQFEHEWFRANRAIGRDVLERGDFSAATDLYQVVDRVRGLRIVPVDVVSLGMLAGATLLPFVPVVLMGMPFDEVVRVLAGFLR